MALVDMGDARDPLAHRNLAVRSAASKKAWRTRKQMDERRRAAEHADDRDD
jgi:hypothetical protein